MLFSSLRRFSPVIARAQLAADVHSRAKNNGNDRQRADDDDQEHGPHAGLA